MTTPPDRALHVGLNLVFVVPEETGGMETAARGLVEGLAETPGLRMTAFVSREGAADRDAPWVEAVPMEVVPVNARNRAAWVWGEQRHLPGMARAAGCDLVHSLGSTSPLRGRFVRVTTIHDLNYKLVPEAHFGLRGAGMRVLVPAAARRADRIIVPAASTARDLVSHLHTPPGKIDVIPHGMSQEPPVGPTAEGELRRRLELADRRVVLSASAKRPHKNLARLLRALAAIDAPRPVLVLPGYATPHEAELRALSAELGIDSDVRLAGWLSAEDLEGLYALADCLVFPSLYEGFGLPVLEAMARGVPVASSDRASLPEVAGDAALLFDPEDVGAITAAIERILGDRALAERLGEAGRSRAATFTWKRAAEQTLASYERALGRSP
jgi:glycosyltransferase involved in cell wall biosynthesis